MTEQRKKALRRKLQESRLRMLTRDFAFSEPLLEMLFVATEDVRRISTNGACIYFDPAWLWKLSDFALDFALGHQLMHIQLEHTERSALFRGDRFHLACDIVANARLIPLGLTAERIAGMGKIYTETFFPKIDGRELDAEEAFGCVPFDPAILRKGQRDQYLIDDESWWDRKEDRGENGTVVLCPEDPEPEDLVCRVEYGERLQKQGKSYKKKTRPLRIGDDDSDSEEAEDPAPPPDWQKTSLQSIQSLRYIKEFAKQCAQEAQSTVRYWHPLKDSKLDWREILHQVLQDTVQDYSFTPPDHRYYESDFFLPNFNDVCAESKEVLFYVDTSGSVEDEMLCRVASEICGAIEQFQGKLRGTLVFFDTAVYSEIPFRTVQDICCSVPDGGGGTDFGCVFRHAARKHMHKRVSSIVIFSDGQGIYPDDWKLNIPVLWVINNKNTVPPFGTVARM